MIRRLAAALALLVLFAAPALAQESVCRRHLAEARSKLEYKDFEGARDDLKLAQDALGKVTYAPSHDSIAKDLKALGAELDTAENAYYREDVAKDLARAQESYAAARKETNASKALKEKAEADSRLARARHAAGKIRDVQAKKAALAPVDALQEQMDLDARNDAEAARKAADAERTRANLADEQRKSADLAKKLADEGLARAKAQQEAAARAEAEAKANQDIAAMKKAEAERAAADAARIKAEQDAHEQAVAQLKVQLEQERAKAQAELDELRKKNAEAQEKLLDAQKQLDQEKRARQDEKAALEKSLAEAKAAAAKPPDPAPAADPKPVHANEAKRQQLEAAATSFWSAWYDEWKKSNAPIDLDAALNPWAADPKGAEGKWVHLGNLVYAPAPAGAPSGAYGMIKGPGPSVVVQLTWSVPASELHTAGAARADVDEPEGFEVVGKLAPGEGDMPHLTIYAVRTAVVAAIPGVGVSTDKVDGIEKVKSPHASEGEFKKAGN